MCIHEPPKYPIVTFIYTSIQISVNLAEIRLLLDIGAQSSYLPQRSYFLTVEEEQVEKTCRRDRILNFAGVDLELSRRTSSRQYVYASRVGCAHFA
jgi:hypothetical protein